MFYDTATIHKNFNEYISMNNNKSTSRNSWQTFQREHGYFKIATAAINNTGFKGGDDFKPECFYRHVVTTLNRKRGFNTGH